MSFSFTSLIRLLVVLAVGSTIVAVGLSRLDPPRPASRISHPSKFTNINEFFLNHAADRVPFWLDADNGLMAGHPLEDGDVLESASCSPWVDEKGIYQAVGRWTSRIKDGPKSISQDFGLARYSFPGGQVLDHVSTEIVPVGPPCWFPGTRARIVFAAGDGMLYQYAFEPEPWTKSTGPASAIDRDPKPRPITWRCPKPGKGDVYLGDLTWPDDPRMGGCLLVSLRQQVVGPKGLTTYTRTTLWWLKLDYAGTEIVEAGQLLGNERETDFGRSFDHRNPTVGTLPDGRAALAFLRQGPGELGWQVRVVPIEFGDDRQIPRASEAKSLLVAERCQPAQPSFSTDGHWLNAITGPDARESRVVRLNLAHLFSITR